MGFSSKMVDTLFKNEELIEDTNHAVELLIKGENGWIHKFVPSLNGIICQICEEAK